MTADNTFSFPPSSPLLHVTGLKLACLRLSIIEATFGGTTQFHTNLMASYSTLYILNDYRYRQATIAGGFY